MTHLALSARGLVRRFGDLVAVDGVDLAVPIGTCLGILGPNGAGKTTTIEMLVGLTRPDAGQIRILGLAWETDARSIRTSMGVQLQETHFQEKITVEETLRLFGSFYPTRRPLEETLAEIGLVEKRRARVGTLSGGQRQRLSLGCALAHRPRILFLDEPTTGLDPQARRRVWEVVEAFTKGGGTVILTTHYMEEAERLADQLVVIDHGKVIAEGSPQSLLASLEADGIVEFRPASTLDAATLTELLHDIPGAVTHRVEGDLVTVDVRGTAVALTALLHRARERGLALDDLRTHRPTLEDVFVSLTGRHLRE